MVTVLYLRATWTAVNIHMQLGFSWNKVLFNVYHNSEILSATEHPKQSQQLSNLQE